MNSLYPRILSSIFLAVSVCVLGAARCGSEPSLIASNVGSQALQLTTDLVRIGPRPPGSAGIEAARTWIRKEIEKRKFSVQSDRFSSETPIGTIEMENLYFVIPGKVHAEQIILLAHYDSKRFVGFDFVGANDAASSVALLLALAPEIQKLNLTFDVTVLFVDGEEALLNWTASDSLYGSRHWASQFAHKGTTKGVFVIDMIGDSDLILIRNRVNDATLEANLKMTLQDLRLSSVLDSEPMDVEDDHVPFVTAGLPILHLMDFRFGGKGVPGKFWHTSEDTVDKISAKSLQTVGTIIGSMLNRLSAPR